MFEYLQTVENVTLGTSNQPHLQNAVKVMNEFKTDIGTASVQRTLELVKSLTDSLSKVEYTLDCLQLKTDALVIIKERCILGNNDLIDIYNDIINSYSVNSGNCTTVVRLSLFFLSECNNVKIERKNKT